jgi:hypothetical protein
VADGPIAVDDEARIATQNQWGIQVGRKEARHVRRTRIPGDVLAEPIPLEPKGMEPFRNLVGCVIADQQRVSAALGIDHLDRGWLIDPD